MKYQMIQKNSSHFTVSKMCQTMDVSRSGYYAYKKCPESERSKRQKDVLKKIRDIHRESHEIYGSPTITVELNNAGTRAGRGMVSRLMRKNFKTVCIDLFYCHEYAVSDIILYVS